MTLGKKCHSDSTNVRLLLTPGKEVMLEMGAA